LPYKASAISKIVLALTRLPLRPVNRLACDGGHQQRGSGENLDNVLLSSFDGDPP
jgi:hypothetical protein